MLTRRKFLTVAAGAASLFVAGCSGEKDEAPAANSAPEPAKDTPTADVAPVGDVLVAYFSATGNTEGVATAIAGRLGADGTNPELAQVTPDGWADYDTVLLGYPIWWGEAAWPLRTFVEGNDFAGKTVVPFCTSGSSGIGSSAELLAEMAGAGEWREGERFSAGAGDEAADWVVGLGL